MFESKPFEHLNPMEASLNAFGSEKHSGYVFQTRRMPGDARDNGQARRLRGDQVTPGDAYDQGALGGVLCCDSCMLLCFQFEQNEHRLTSSASVPVV